MAAQQKTKVRAPPVVGHKLGNYRLRRVLGRGQMGVVYLAWDEVLQRETALKVLSWRMDAVPGQDPVRWFLDEARHVAKVNHPCVIQIYSAAKHGGHCYIAMEYVEGRSAAAIVKEQGPFTPAEATEILTKAAAGLEAAHQRGVIHRDVKPANLLISAQGDVKVSDFGMALNLRRNSSRAHLRVGTPFMMAPEIWRGNKAGPSADIYALGATYYYLLAGRHGYDRQSIEELRKAHLEEAVPDPRHDQPELTAACAQLIATAMAKNPRERFATAQDLGLAAHGVLKKIESRPRRRAISIMVPRLAIVDDDRPALEIANRSWRGLGFDYTPFGRFDPADPPYAGPPFSNMRTRLLASVANTPGSTTFLSGCDSSGRTATAVSFIQSLVDRPTVYLDVAGGEPIIRRIIRTLGPADASTDVSALVARLESNYARYGAHAVVLLDHVDLAGGLGEELAQLSCVAKRTRLLSLLLTGTMGMEVMGTDACLDDAASAELAIPPLDRRQVVDYVQAWLAATRSPDAPPLLFSVDATLLLAHFSEGVPGRINMVASNMVLLGCHRGQHVLRSWHAWVAARHGKRLRSPAEFDPRLVAPPAQWPTEEALSVLNACREANGVMPRRVRRRAEEDLGAEDTIPG